jgi:hypothetical protein
VQSGEGQSLHDMCEANGVVRRIGCGFDTNGCGVYYVLGVTRILDCGSYSWAGERGRTAGGVELCG